MQFSSAIGPYKGGLRFHPTVRVSAIHAGADTCSLYANGQKSMLPVQSRQSVSFCVQVTLSVIKFLGFEQVIIVFPSPCQTLIWQCCWPLVATARTNNTHHTGSCG